MTTFETTQQREREIAAQEALADAARQQAFAQDRNARAVERQNNILSATPTPY